MRAVAVVSLVLMTLAGPSFAGTDIHAVCYEDCANGTSATPEYDACVARAADKADAALNQAFKALQDTIRKDAKEMDQKPDQQLSFLKDAQKKWIVYRDANCDLEGSLAFGGTSQTGNGSSCLCVLTYQRIDDFTRMTKDVMGE